MVDMISCDKEVAIFWITRMIRLGHVENAEITITSVINQCIEKENELYKAKVLSDKQVSMLRRNISRRNKIDRRKGRFRK